MKQVIYADNAATTRLDAPVFDAMKPFLLEEYGNPSQPYSLSRAPKKAIKDARETIASCIGALPEEIFFTSGGTESDNWAIKGTAYSNMKKHLIVSSAIEHHAILRACASINRIGFPVVYLNPNRYGVISPSCLEETITDRTQLVSIMFSNNEIGTIEPIKELAIKAHNHGALFHTDAVQAVGHVKIDVRDLNVDMLSASAHKFNGPKGVGFLFIRKGITLAPFINGGSQENGLRAGTENIAGIVGMATALQINNARINDNKQHISKLEKILLSELSGLDFIKNGSDNRLHGNLSLSFKGCDGEAILHRLDLMGICVSTGSACDSVHSQVSHVLRAIKLDDSYAKGTIRISLGKDNTEEEMYIIANALRKIIKL